MTENKKRKKVIIYITGITYSMFILGILFLGIIVSSNFRNILFCLGIMDTILVIFLAYMAYKTSMIKPDTVVIEGFIFSDEVYDKIVGFMRDKNKIKAISEVRLQTHLGLKESKEFVERLSFAERIPMAKGYGGFYE